MSIHIAELASYPSRLVNFKSLEKKLLGGYKVTNFAANNRELRSQYPYLSGWSDITFQQTDETTYNALNAQHPSVELTFTVVKYGAKSMFDPTLVQQSIKHTKIQVLGFSYHSGDVQEYYKVVGKTQVRGGAKRSTTSYVKTSQVHVGRDGFKRVVYVKNNKRYVKRKDPATGRFKLVAIRS